MNSHGSREFFLTTPRLGFSRWTEGDLPLALSLWGDPAVTALIGGPFNPEKVGQRLALEIETTRAHGVQYWPIFRMPGAGPEEPVDPARVFAGCAGLRPYRIEDRIFELGVHLRPECWGKGLAREAAAAVIQYAFETLDAEALFAGHHPENASSRKLLGKLGFQFTHRELYPPTGLEHPSYLLAREDWPR